MQKQALEAKREKEVTVLTGRSFESVFCGREEVERVFFFLVWMGGIRRNIMEKKICIVLDIFTRKK